jgi:TolB-like protein/Tfp pilus assembly protein PilF
MEASRPSDARTMADGTDAPERVAVVPSQRAPDLGAASSAVHLDQDALKLEKKRDKVRAAWIAFVGRILAQLIGAVATVGLGLYVVRTYGVEGPGRRSAPAPTAVAAAMPAALPRPALVVLPFQIYSPTGTDQRLSDGFTESLIADLSRIPDLRVVSRTSSMYYRGTNKTLPAIAKELDVDLVVEASVARQADRVRVTVQLIEAASDSHVWSQTYDRRSVDLLALQADVTRTASQDLRAAIAPRQERALAERAGLPAAVIGDYLRGRSAFDRRSPGDLATATLLFERVVSRAPAFAPAHAALAATWCLRALDAFGAQASRQALDKAEASALEAARLDESNPDAHLAIAVVRHRRDWKWADAEREFLRVFELREGHITGHQWYSIFLAEQGRHDQADQQAARALALDPHSAAVHRTAGVVALYGRRLDAAEAALRRALALDRSAGVTRMLLASVLLEQGRHEQARAMAAAVKDEELQDQRLALLAHAAMRLGNRSAATRYRAAIADLPGPRSLMAEARLCAAAGDTDALVATAARAVEQRTQLAAALKVHPLFEPVRQAVAFQSLMRRVGLS